MSSTADNDKVAQDGPSQEVVQKDEATPLAEASNGAEKPECGDSEGSPRVMLNGDSTADNDEADSSPLYTSNGNPSGSVRRKKYKRRTKSRSSLANIIAMANADANSVPNSSPPTSPTSTSSPARVQPSPSPRKPNPSPRSPRVTPPQLDPSHLDLTSQSTTTTTTSPTPIPTTDTTNTEDGPRPEGRGRSNAFYGRSPPPTPNFLNNNNNARSPSYSDILTGAASTRHRSGPPAPLASSSNNPPNGTLPTHTYSGICRPSKFNWTKKGDPKYDCVRNNSRRFLIGFAETIGRRPTMEDCMVIDGSFRGSNEEDYFAVFDGHGGRDSARFAADHLHTILADKLKSGNPVKSLKEAFAETNNLIKEQKIAGGTTACVVLFIGKKGYVANVGDTRAVLCRDGITHRVSLDHKPELPAETSRIKNLGGTVTTTTNAAGHSTSRVNGMLAVSRALGDTVLQPYVSAEPEIHGPLNITTTTDDNNQFMVMACDGVWDVISDEEAASIVAPIPDVEAACKRLRDEAFQRGSTDNISVMVIRFPQPKPR